MDEEFKKRYIDETRFIIYGLKQKRPLTKTQQTLFKAIEKRLSRC